MSERRLTQPAGRLRCVECAATSTHGIGWRGYLTVDEDEPAEVVILCPECAAREFDGE